MAFKLNRSSKEPMSEINVTPFVDVMLVLLIIFMVTAPLLTVGVQVDLPESSADSLPEEVEPLTLTINSKGEIFIQESKVEYEKIIAKEGRQGTKKMLSKVKKNSKGILIKLPKNKQDLRMDLPTVGLQTLKDIKKYGLKGLVLKSKKNIFLDKKEAINFANKNKIFVKVI